VESIALIRFTTRAALAGALLLGPAALAPANAMPVATAPAVSAAGASPVTEVQWRRWGGAGWHGGYRPYRHSGNRGAWAAGAAGLAAGALLGGAIASQPRSYDYGPGYTVVEPDTTGTVYASPQVDEDYCIRRYRSYDPASGTFLGYDGLRHPCP
jgi:hypothetical protein